MRLVIDHAAIEEAERRRRGEAACEPWWRRQLMWVSLAMTLVPAALAAWSLVELLADRRVGPLATLLADLTRATRRATLLGGIALIAGIVAVARRRRRRHFRSAPAIVAHSLAIVVGAAALVVGSFHWLALAGGGGGYQYTSMPERPTGLDAPTPIERILNATVVVLAPGADGDARRLAMGTGAVVARDDRRAWIVTCSHVAMPYAAVGAFRHARTAQPVWIQLADGRQGEARVRWAAPPPLDIALLELPIEQAPEPVRVSVDDSALPVGASVTFVPNPYRAGWKVGHGRLLRREPHRTPAGAYDLLFTDLPVTHGDSGSGLFDARGQLVGLNTWTRISGDGPSQGIGLPAAAMGALVEAIDRGALDTLDDALQSATRE